MLFIELQTTQPSLLRPPDNPAAFVCIGAVAVRKVILVPMCKTHSLVVLKTLYHRLPCLLVSATGSYQSKCGYLFSARRRLRGKRLWFALHASRRHTARHAQQCKSRSKHFHCIPSDLHISPLISLEYLFGECETHEGPYRYPQTLLAQYQQSTLLSPCQHP